MFEPLTRFIGQLNAEPFGRWQVDTENDGTIEHPFRMPFVRYSRAADGLVEAVYAFTEAHGEMELKGYQRILAESGVSWDVKSMTEADVSGMDGRTVVALLLGAVRMERFCDGALLGFLENGSVGKWLARLGEIDGAGRGGQAGEAPRNGEGAKE